MNTGQDMIETPENAKCKGNGCPEIYRGTCHRYWSAVVDAEGPLINPPYDAVLLTCPDYVAGECEQGDWENYPVSDCLQ